MSLQYMASLGMREFLHQGDWWTDEEVSREWVLCRISYWIWDAYCSQGPWEGSLGLQESSEPQFWKYWLELNLFLMAWNKTICILYKILCICMQDLYICSILLQEKPKLKITITIIMIKSLWKQLTVLSSDYGKFHTVIPTLSHGWYYVRPWQQPRHIDPINVQVLYFIDFKMYIFFTYIISEIGINLIFDVMSQFKLGTIFLSQYYIKL